MPPRSTELSSTLKVGEDAGGVSSADIDIDGAQGVMTGGT
jgi:hypothetical protein